MSYALRNSLILAVILAAILGGGYYWVGVHQVDRIRLLQARHEELELKLEETTAVLAVYDTAQAQLTGMERRWRQRHRFVPASDTPDQTLAYLDDVIALAGGGMNFDFLYKGERREGRCMANVYAIAGEGRFENVYAFLHYLERGPRFYTLDRLQLSYSESEARRSGTGSDWIDFQAVFRCYHQPQGVGRLPVTLAATQRPTAVTRNPFAPLIARRLPPNTLGLPEVEGGRLQALTHDMAFVLDTRKQLHVLRPGDRVYLGRLERVDINRNRAVFLLNKGGIWKRLTLTVDGDQ